MPADHFFEIAQNHFNDALPFVLYRKPNALTVKAMFQNNDTVYTSENLTESGFVFAPFNDEKRTVLIPKNQSDALECEIDFIENENNTFEKEDEIFQPSESNKNSHIKLVSKAIEAINSNTLEKVVLSRTETVNLKESNAFQLYKRLLSQYKTAFVYCWYHPKIGLWLGATPETLLTVSGNRFITMALAGTQEKTDAKSVSWQAKEMDEQQLVTNFITTNIEPIVDSFSVSKIETIQAGTLLHLRTKISGLFSGNLKALVAALHPTPAVCGLPKNQAKAFILENENYNREFYTGFLGEINIIETKKRNRNTRNVENSAYSAIKTVSNLFVNLRCMQLTDVKATVYVGGGITKDSIPEKEWLETVNKSKTMKAVL